MNNVHCTMCILAHTLAGAVIILQEVFANSAYGKAMYRCANYETTAFKPKLVSKYSTKKALAILTTKSHNKLCCLRMLPFFYVLPFFFSLFFSIKCGRNSFPLQSCFNVIPIKRDHLLGLELSADCGTAQLRLNRLIAYKSGMLENKLRNNNLDMRSESMPMRSRLRPTAYANFELIYCFG